MNPLLSTCEVAKILGLKEQTIRLWRLKNSSLKYVRYGGRKGRVFYRREDVEAFIASNIHSNTSEEAVAYCQK